MQQELSLETTKRPGGRSARVRAAVRQATLDELVAHGYAGLTIDNVAQRSGVHKTTVYRRWGSPAGLVADALELAAEEAWPLPDTGDLTADLRALTAAVHTGFTDPDAAPATTNPPRSCAAPSPAASSGPRSTRRRWSATPSRRCSTACSSPTNPWTRH